MRRNDETIRTGAGVTADGAEEEGGGTKRLPGCGGNGLRKGTRPCAVAKNLSVVSPMGICSTKKEGTRVHVTGHAEVETQGRNAPSRCSIGRVACEEHGLTSKSAFSTGPEVVGDCSQCWAKTYGQPS